MGFRGGGGGKRGRGWVFGGVEIWHETRWSHTGMSMRRIFGRKGHFLPPDWITFREAKSIRNGFDTMEIT